MDWYNIYYMYYKFNIYVYIVFSSSITVNPQRTLNCNNTYAEDGGLYRSGIGESNVSLDSTLRSAKSRSSYLAYALRYNTLTDCTAASPCLLHNKRASVCVCVCVFVSTHRFVSFYPLTAFSLFFLCCLFVF